MKGSKMIDVYELCKVCDCYCDDKLMSLHYGYYDGAPFYVCFDCQV